MLLLLERSSEVKEAQRTFREQMETSWSNSERRRVVWRPSSREMRIWHNGRFWFASRSPDSADPIPRFWNPFGEYKSDGNLAITVEMNIAANATSRRIAGFFARDASTGSVCLMHDGGVGGGRKGVGRAHFLNWSSALPEPVESDRDNDRLGLLIGRTLKGS